ncbi:hypothetical protein V6N13_061373 [Hibiscus sabdariffa]|uniref:Uncharacterized protein n=1 Tax=Hibiscus sabdariffa TaxID=183260 RepID=A0ABR2EJ80_9ROSI
MEPSETFGAAEECHSNESGWTMYIGDDADGETQTEADQDCAHATETDAKHGAETDDSMASDASSGPSHYGRFRAKHGVDEEDGRHCYSEKKAKKPTVGKQKLETKRKQDKEERTIFKTKESSTRSPSDSYVKKNIWFGKRK